MRAAEEALSQYLTEKHNPAVAVALSSGDPKIYDVLALYLEQRVEKQARPSEARARIKRLALWWKERRCSEIKPSTCQAYAKSENAGQIWTETQEQNETRKLQKPGRSGLPAHHIDPRKRSGRGGRRFKSCHSDQNFPRYRK